MNKQEIEKRIVELKAAQSAIFNKKKADRDAAELEAVRKELNELKGKAREAYKA